MNLNDAITHSLNIAVSDCGECGKEHEQLAKWLIELRDIRKFVESLRSFNTHNLYLEELKKIVGVADER